MQNAKFKEYINFKKQLQDKFGGKVGYISKAERKDKLNRQLEHYNMVFQQLNPNMKKKLSNIVIEDNYQFDRAYQMYVVQPPKSDNSPPVTDRTTDLKKQTASIFKVSVSNEELPELSNRKNVNHLKLDSLLKKQATELSANRGKTSRSKNSSYDSFLLRKTKSMIADQMMNPEDSLVTQTGGGILMSDRLLVNEKGYLPLLGVAHQRSASTRHQSLTNKVVVNALQEQIEVARNRHRSKRQHQDNIIKSMQLSLDRPTQDQRFTLGTKLTVKKGMLEEKLEIMAECQLDSHHWQWKPKKSELSCVVNAVPPKASPDRQILRSKADKPELGSGLKLKTPGSRLERIGFSAVERQANILKFDM